jgi:hypothetical protein
VSPFRTLFGVSVFVVTGCSRTDLSLLQVGDSPGAGGGPFAPAMYPDARGVKLPTDASAGMNAPEGSPGPSPTTTPTSGPPPGPTNRPRDAGVEAGGSPSDGGAPRDGDVPSDAGRCEVDPTVSGRLVGTWVWNGELALVSWDTTDGTFTNRTLGVPGTSAALALGPAELGIARILPELVDGGAVEFVEMFRVAPGIDSDPIVRSSVRIPADGARGVAVVWTGERYLIAWLDSTSVWIQRISRDGTADGAPQVVFEGHPVFGIELVSRAPGEVAILCEDYDNTRGAFFAMLDGAGALASAPVWVTGTVHSVNHRLVATRQGYAVSYVQNTNDAYVVVINPKAQLVARTHVGEACFSQWTCGPSSVVLYGGSTLASNGCELALLYNVPAVGESRGLRLSRIGEDGAVRSPEIAIVDRKLSVWPRLGWDRAHGHWAAAWGEFDTTYVSYGQVGLRGLDFWTRSYERGLAPTLGLVFVPDDWR